MTVKRRIATLLIAVMVCFAWTTYDYSIVDGITKDAASIAYADSIKRPTIKVSTSSYDGLKISWSKVSGAQKYYIYRSNSSSGTYKKIGSTYKTTYLDKKIDQNRRYYYKVRAVNGKALSSYSLYKSGKITTAVKLSAVTTYSGSAAVSINGNQPKFSSRMKTTTSKETYSKLDSLGRCGIAYACIGRDLMPTEERSSIGMIKPAGWHTVRYDDLVDGKYLYNRCHLIGFQLTGENDNERNLITGTRYLNVDGMLPYENMVADYIQSTGNHVLYRVTPIYSGDDLLCRGVQMEAYSVEDNGEGICFNVFAYNVQPGIKIHYSTGESERVSGEKTDNTGTTPTEITYVLNKNTKKFHIPTCSSVADINASNKEESSSSRETIISKGYDPCKRCNP